MVNKIQYYIYSSGDNPVKEFIDSLEMKQKIKVFHIFKLIIEYGINSIPQHVKKLSGTPLWEIKILGKDNIRILYIISRRETVLLLHGFIKKTQKTNPKEINIAIKRYRQWYLTNDMI
ncbi:type II toxin-antitoxin system RelE/ParE family toxin [Candidatus Roizmanbacteria bacterium]|nr:type II toxin-antitoxin system RelE/ParE family toxin [Candidatus Roizmanbacteria bacterium]